MIPSSSSPFRESAPAHFPLRISLLFCGPLIVNGFAMPYFPVWLKTLEISDFEIGIILSIPMFVRVVTAPFAGLLADRIGERLLVLLWSAVLSLITALALFVSHSFWYVLIVYAIQGGVYSPYMPIVEAIALTGVRRWGYDYARMRLWGSVAFIGATMLGGPLIGVYGGGVVLPAMAVSFMLMTLITLIGPRVGRPRRPSTLTALTEPTPRVLRAPDLQMLLIGVSLINGSHAMLFAFSAIYWTQIGMTGTEIGLLWSAGVAAEVLMFLCAKSIIRRFSLWTMIFSGCGLAVVRWLLFPLDLGFGGYFVLQCFHAFTYAIMHTGLQNMLVRRVPEEQEASAQGLYFFYSGMFLAIFTFVAGYLFNWFGVHGFYAMSAVALLGCLFAATSFMLSPQRNAQAAST